MKNKKTYSSLSWKLSDYELNQCEVPDRIKKYPEKTEGEMMNEEEIQHWFSDSMRVLQILKEEDKEVFEKVHAGFLTDLEYLLSLGKIEEDVLEFITEEKNFDFDKEEGC